MISFEERYYLPLITSYSLPPTSSALININSVAVYSLPTNSGGFSSKYLFIGFENKIIVNEIIDNEICTRDINILSSFPLVNTSYHIQGIWTLTFPAEFFPPKSFLYVSIVSTHPEISTSNSTLFAYPHLLIYEIHHQCHQENQFQFQFIQDLKFSYHIIDVKNYIYDKHLFLCCLGTGTGKVKVNGKENGKGDETEKISNEQILHLYEIDSNGNLLRKSKRAKKARAYLNNRMCKNLTNELLLPSRFEIEDWSHGGSQCLVGYIDGHLYWSRECRVEVSNSTVDDEYKAKDNDNVESIFVSVPPPPDLTLVGSPSSKELSPAKAKIIDAKPLEVSQPTTIIIPPSPSSPHLRIIANDDDDDEHDGDADHLLTITEGSDEDDEDSVDSTLRQYPTPSKPQSTRSPYTKNTSLTTSTPSRRDTTKENIWDDMIEADLDEDVVNTHISSSNIDTKLYEIYSHVFHHHPLQCIIPRSNFSLSTSTKLKEYTYSYLLNGSISSIQFYHREAAHSRSICQKYSPSFLSSPSSSPTRLNPTLSNHNNSIANSPSSLPNLRAQFSNQPMGRWKESLTGRVHHPSSCALIGTSEGNLVLLSLERKIVQNLVYHEANDVQIPSWSWEEDDDDPFIMRSMFITSSSANFGSILCVCIADVTGNGLNDVIVGYDTGLVRILSILDSSSSSVQSSTNDLTRSHSHSCDHEFPLENKSLQSDHSCVGHSLNSSHQRHSQTLNDECWSLTNSSFHEISQLHLPFPIMSIQYGQYLGSESSIDGEKAAMMEGERNIQERREASSTGGGGSIPMNHLVITTTKSVHICIPCKKKECWNHNQSPNHQDEKEMTGNGNRCEGVENEENEESLEILEEKKRLILQLLAQLDQLGERASKINIC